MGSKNGSITFNRDLSYRLELKFEKGELVQSGKYKIEGDLLTLTPTKGATAESEPISLKLTWKDAKTVSAIATRPGQKPTKFFFWR